MTNKEEKTYKPFRFEIVPTTTPDGKEAQYFISLVKFDGNGQKGPKDFAKFFYDADCRLRELDKKPRKERGIHEDKTYITFGRYDMVVIWHARNKEVADRYMRDLLSAGLIPDPETLVATAEGRY